MASPALALPLAFQVLLACGEPGRRYALPNARVMIYQPMLTLPLPLPLALALALALPLPLALALALPYPYPFSYP